ncbi:hypothetical protein FVEG_01633 [Fusarium verticillioides 7600]|uniref:Uncharacterized protein n=1 Tax=Gibberella moniliformis (strain M3125 / FGSC 7600) TaxID=334819 RepID=W7M0J3_GIBM7|nr:hypothetical protein FVEG_01633 [Fusarium verticillioides 7600]EWG38422.1 hypothetical protein FVEG_01633 [Fusarium verticillioides 7600]
MKGKLSKDGRNCNEELKGMVNKPKAEVSKKRRERIDEAMKCCIPPGSEKKTTKAKILRPTVLRPTVLRPRMFLLNKAGLVQWGDAMGS